MDISETHKSSVVSILIIHYINTKQKIILPNDYKTLDMTNGIIYFVV